MIGKASGDVAASAPGIYGDLRAQSNKGFAAHAVNAVARREAMITAQLGGERHSLWAVAAAVAAVRRRRAETATPFAGERNNDEPQQWRRRLRRRGARRAPRDLRRGEGGAVGGVLGGRGGARGGGADGWRM